MQPSILRLFLLNNARIFTDRHEAPSDKNSLNRSFDQPRETGRIRRLAPAIPPAGYFD